MNFENEKKPDSGTFRIQRDAAHLNANMNATPLKTRLRVVLVFFQW